MGKPATVAEVVTALTAAEGNVAQAAKDIGCSQANLFARISNNLDLRAHLHEIRAARETRLAAHYARLAEAGR